MTTKIKLKSKTHKRCSKCGVLKPLTEFHAKNGSSEKKHSHCKPCQRKMTTEYKYGSQEKREAYQQRERIRKSLPENRRKTRDYKLRKAYGVTLEYVERLVVEQGGLCGVCKTTPVVAIDRDCGKGNGRSHVDHDHITGQVRGVLCGLCNYMLGAAKDDPRILMNAISYLERAS